MEWKSVPWRLVLRWISVFAAVAAMVLVIVVLFGPITDLIARHDVSALPGPQRAVHLQAARETARTQLLTLGAGLFAAGALLFTARNYNLSREGQVTDRYTKAIEQLGSEKLDVRIGGIYALERIARDSRRDHPIVMEVLSAFIRDHSHEEWPVSVPNTEQPERSTRPDIQAAITVLGRRDNKRDIRQINLSHANLIGANISRANLAFAFLAHANFTRATFASANLHFADLASATLSGADLQDCDLSNAHLFKAYLQHAELPRANLREAVLTDADFIAATFSVPRLLPR